MSDCPSPELLAGSPAEFQDAYRRFQQQPVDDRWDAPADWSPQKHARTIARAAHVEGPATYSRGKTRRLDFLPSEEPGWLFKRTDLPEQLPVQAILGNVSQADRAIVLRAGIDANRVRMSEHIICHRLGLGIDCLRIEMASEDPPLFDQGSMPIVEALSEAGVTELPACPLSYLTPKTSVALLRPENGGFLLWEPAIPGDLRFRMDVAIDFPTAIGQQRIQLELWDGAFRHGAVARTNCSLFEMRLAQTLGKFHPKYRGLGYTTKNILLAGKKSYANPPQLVHPSGKALEAVWHRTCLDLVAALSLLPPGTRPAGRLNSYKAGHLLDVRFLTVLLGKNLLQTTGYAR